MSGGARFLTRGLRAVKAEAALLILAFNILYAVNAIGYRDTQVQRPALPGKR
jgi:transposase